MAKNITLMGADYPDVPAVQLPQTGGGTATFYDINVIDNLNSDSSTDALSAKQGKVLDAKKLNVIEKSTGSGKTFTITFDGSGGGYYALIYGRFGYDPTKLSMAIISHDGVNDASIVCFGSETATVTCANNVVTVTTQNNYAAVTVVSSKTIS